MAGVESAHLERRWTSRGPFPTGSSLHPAHGVAIVEVVSGDGVLRLMSVMPTLRQQPHRFRFADQPGTSRIKAGQRDASAARKSRDLGRDVGLRGHFAARARQYAFD